MTLEKATDEALAEEERLKQHSIILGGDAQFDAWAKITEEFPELQHTGNRGQMIDPDVIEHKPSSLLQALNGNIDVINSRSHNNYCVREA